MRTSTPPIGSRRAGKRLVAPRSCCAALRGSRRRSRRRFRVWPVAAVGVLFVLAACGGSDSSASSKTTSTRNKHDATSTTTAASRAGTQAITAYKAMRQDMVAASETANYQSPRLADHAVGDALSLLVRGVYANKAHGVVVKGEPVTHPRVTGVTPPDNPTNVSISDCFDATKWLEYDATTGALKDDTPGGRHTATATVALTDGVWKVTQLLVGGLGTC